MHRSLVMLVLAGALALSALAMAPPPTFTVVGSEDCVAGPDLAEAATPDWADLCTLAFATVDERTIQVRVTAVGPIEGRPAPATYQAGWYVGPCVVNLESSDHLDGARSDRLTALCTDRPILQEAIPTPSFDGDAVTWTVSFVGPLAGLAPLHAPGAALEDAVGAAANSATFEAADVSVRSGIVAPEVCAGTICTSPLDDRVDADRAYVVRNTD